MGLAASQARLISLTARMSDIEYEGQQINQQRQVLTNKMNEVYSKAMDMPVPTPPSKIDFPITRYTGKADGTKVNIEMTKTGEWFGYEVKTAPSAENSEYKYNQTITFNKGDIVPDEWLSELAAPTDEDQRLLDGPVTVNKPNIEGHPLSDLSVVAEEKGDETNFKNALEGFKNYCAQKGIEFDENNIQVFTTENKNSDGVKSTVYNFVFKDSLQADGQNVKTYHYLLSDDARVPISNIHVQYDTNDPTLITGFEYTDANGVTKPVSVSVDGQAYDEKAYNRAYVEYERDKVAYDREQNEFNKQTSIYQRQDKQLELKLTRLDNERNALNTEIESVKKVIQDASEKGFKTFSG